MAYLRYTNGAAPFARTPLYTASSALLILEASTRRSVAVLMRSGLAAFGEDLGLTVDEQQECHLLCLVISIGEVRLSAPGDVFVSVVAAILVRRGDFAFSLGRRGDGAVQEFFGEGLAIQQANRLLSGGRGWRRYVRRGTSGLHKHEEDAPLMSLQLTFLHVKETRGLCIAYLVTTSRIRVYSSEDPRRADRRVGVL